MFYEETIDVIKAKPLLEACGLSVPAGVEYTVGVYDDASGELVATGSLKGDMIQGIAVSPKRQGEDLMGKLLTHLIGVASARGKRSLHLFTKPEKAVQFQGLGFRQVAVARPYAALLEWGEGGIGEYQERLAEYRKEAERRLDGKRDIRAAALVMNCNPFTRGHRYLVEQACQAADIVYLIVVEEDRSLFSFKDRLEMVKRGTADLDAVTVLSGGRYAVSSLTFPSYFTKEENLACAHTAMDAELFGRCIAPALGVSLRLVGEEPLSPVTAIYNEALKSRLPGKGIEVQVIPRKQSGGVPISASYVRELLFVLWEKGQWLEPGESGGAGASAASVNGAEGDSGDEIRSRLKELLPETTYEYLCRPEMRTALSKKWNEKEK